jgi:hypothetical protein
MTRTIAIVALLAACAAGCDKAQTPTSAESTTTSTTATALFSGTLESRGEAFYSFTVTQAGSVRLTLASLSAANGVAAASIDIGMGLGVPAGTGCAMSSATTVTPALTAQVVEVLDAGVHCANIFDAGTLTAPATFAMRIVHP